MRDLDNRTEGEPFSSCHIKHNLYSKNEISKKWRPFPQQLSSLNNKCHIFLNVWENGAIFQHFWGSLCHLLWWYIDAKLLQACYWPECNTTRNNKTASFFCQQKCLFTEKKAEIEKLAEEYVVTVKNLASEQRVEHLQKIQNAYSKCKEFSDDKVQLAMQTYEMVSAECFTNICSKVSTSYIIPVWSAGGQTYPQTRCRSCALWERVKGETGSGRLWEHRRESSEEWAAGRNASRLVRQTGSCTSTSHGVCFPQKVRAVGSGRNAAPGGEEEKVQMRILLKRKRWKTGTFRLNSHNAVLLFCFC